MSAADHLVDQAEAAYAAAARLHDDAEAFAQQAHSEDAYRLVQSADQLEQATGLLRARAAELWSQAQGGRY